MLVTLIYIPIITLIIMNINLLIFKNVELYKSFKFIEVSFDKIIKIINILSINITLSYSLYIWRYCQILKNMIFIINLLYNYNIVLLIQNMLSLILLFKYKDLLKINKIIHTLHIDSLIKLGNIKSKILFIYKWINDILKGLLNNIIINLWYILFLYFLFKNFI